jgi:hypothetical protein
MNWPTQKENMEIATRILALHRDKDTGLVSLKPGGQDSFQAILSPWLAELTKALVKRHGLDQGMETLRYVLRELGVFSKPFGD